MPFPTPRFPSALAPDPAVVAVTHDRVARRPRRAPRGTPVVQRAVLAVAALLFLGAAPLAPVAAQEGSPAQAPTGAQETAAPFSAIRIEPAGRQVFDIGTGETVLPDGGTVVAAEGGIRLTAPTIRYVENRYVEADDAVISGDFGTVRGQRVRFDLEAGTVEVDGGIVLTRASLDLRADAIRYDTATELVRVLGPVTGQNPDFEARQLLLDALTGRALLLGPYRYAGDPFTLADERETARLELDPAELGDQLVYDARSEVAPATLERFAPLLP